MKQRELDIEDDDPASRTVRLLLSRGLTQKEASDWGEGAQSEEEAQEIATWLELHPQAKPLEILSMLIEVLIPEELKHPKCADRDIRSLIRR